MKFTATYSSRNDHILYDVSEEETGDGFTNFKLIAHDFEVLDDSIIDETDTHIMFRLSTEATKTQKCLLMVFKACAKSGRKGGAK